ncbi:InlB B-repeat-containing protein, partial [Collinsella aerofaciens]|uniref:InlB B-repeat-containing protein n=2 Tax=Bacillati TaxID=1783272 RepID=UPI001EDF96D3
LPVTALQNDGYLFGGWTPDDGTTIYQPGESYTMPSQDTTLKAFWYQTLTPGEVAPVTAEYGTEIAPVVLSAT